MGGNIDFEPHTQMVKFFFFTKYFTVTRTNFRFRIDELKFSKNYYFSDSFFYFNQWLGWGVIGFEKISDVGTDMVDSMTPPPQRTNERTNECR